MTAVTMSTGMITIQLPRRRTPVLRRLALSAGLALLTWSGARASVSGHDEQARLIATENAVRRTRDGFRYGFVQ